MAKRIVVLILVLTSAFVLGLRASAQNQTGSGAPQVGDNWQGLDKVKPGTVLILYTKKGQEIEGKFADVSGSNLGLVWGFKVLDFEQRDIAEVRLKPSSKKGRITGAVVGTVAMGILAGIGTARWEKNQTTRPEPSFTPGLGLLGGGALGYAVGLRFDQKRKGKLLFKSP